MDHKNRKRKGASLVEYVILLALIALVAIAGISKLGQATNKKYQKVAEVIGE